MEARTPRTLAVLQQLQPNKAHKGNVITWCPACTSEWSWDRSALTATANSEGRQKRTVAMEQCWDSSTPPSSADCKAWFWAVQPGSLILSCPLWETQEGTAPGFLEGPAAWGAGRFADPFSFGKLWTIPVPRASRYLMVSNNSRLSSLREEVEHLFYPAILCLWEEKAVGAEEWRRHRDGKEDFSRVIKIHQSSRVSTKVTKQCLLFFLLFESPVQSFLILVFYFIFAYWTKCKWEKKVGKHLSRILPKNEIRTIFFFGPNTEML